MLNHHHLGDAANEKSSECPDPAIPNCAQQHGQGETNEKSDGMDVLMLPHHPPSFFEVAHVIERRLGERLKQKPADVSMEKSLGDIVWVLLVIAVSVMAPLSGRSHKYR